MAIFITGSTGYLGSHVASGLLEGHGQKLNLLVRAKDRRAAELKLWRALQLHLDFPRFDHWLNSHIEIFLGDITLPEFGLHKGDYVRLMRTTDSVLHIAASLNRKSEKACLNVNLRGTLEVLKFAGRVLAHHGLRRYSHVSTVAVAGMRSNEVVTEAASIDWERSDYDPYARTKKFCEHMARELLPNVPLTIFRPSIVLGDSRHGETTQFDMVKAFVFLARRRVLPLRPNDRLDIVNVDFVADSIVTLHQKEKPLYDIYHLSSGMAAPTARQITNALAQARGQNGPLYVPALAGPFDGIVNWLANRRGTSVGQMAALLKVFLPYLLWNTVFDNQRVVQETGKSPANFTHYGFPLFEFSSKHHFTYPYREWPEAAGEVRLMMDLALGMWVSGLIELSKLRWMLGSGEAWQPGVPLKLLFAGYNGNRNTGADVRVEEMIRQVRRVLGDEHLDLSVLSHNLSLSAGYFDRTRQVKLPDVFPPFLFREISQYHGVLACEGSMFKSTFANALTSMMIGSLGIAAAENKLSVGYGAEAGHMDPLIQRMSRRYCADSLVITRNEESQTVLGRLGVPTELGTDTAWTFEPLGSEYADNVLRQAGWDGQTPVLGLCPINPFWWPVRPSLVKLGLRSSLGLYQDSHYRSIYFFKNGAGVTQVFHRYLNAFAEGVQAFRRDHRVFPVMIGMEALDRRACEIMGERLGGVPLFISDQYDMYQLVSILRHCHLLVSSRYHGIVTCMPALVPSAGVTMDERIRNLMGERGHHDLLLEVDDPNLASKLVVILNKLLEDGESIRDGIGRTVVRNLKVMARMGVYFQQHVQLRYPEFPFRTGRLSWEDYLPPLGQRLKRLAEEYE